jgi:hypothetical protein
VCGKQGSGKSLFCSAMLLGKYQKGFKVYSNVKLNFPSEQLNYADIINCRLHDCVVYLSEAHLILPRRNAMRSSSKNIVDNFVSMSAKANITLVCDTQFPQKIDSRIAELEKDYNVLCEKYILENGQWVQTSKDAKELGDTPTIINVSIEQCYDRKITKLRLHANKYYSLYNRYEIINIRGLEEAEEIRKATLRVTKQRATKEAIKNLGESEDD